MIKLLLISFLLFSTATAQNRFFFAQNNNGNIAGGGSSANGSFSFTLALQTHTSAGVFKNDSVLVRTLWSDSVITAGTKTSYWDGRDDNGKLLTSPSSTYKVKVTGNNVGYQWRGVIGNSSDSMTGTSVFKGYYDCMLDLVFTNGYGYYCTGYGEGGPSVFKFSQSAIGKKISIYSPTTSVGNPDYVCTDDTTVFWSNYDPYAYAQSWVFGTNISDDQEKLFTSGRVYSLNVGNHTFMRAISRVTDNNGRPGGIAVQKAGIYLFVARPGINQLHVMNKYTGDTVQTSIYINVREISMSGNTDIWMITDTNTVSKYPINANGTLGTATLTLSGLIDPLSTKVSADGNTIAVSDGGTSQQVKFYSNSTGAAISTQGVAGGYVNDATVTNNKFYMADARKKHKCFVSYQSDGSYWVNDHGNYRVQHYASSSTFLNRIMSLGSIYSTKVDKNNINRIFGNFLEFNVDYTIPLTGTTGWTLTKNWGATITSAYDVDLYNLKSVTTLSNGKTYGFCRTSLQNEMVELTSTGTLRFTGVMNQPQAVILADGGLQVIEEYSDSMVVKKKPFTGFDGLNNITWGTAQLISSQKKATRYFGSPVGTSVIDFPLDVPVFDSSNVVMWYNPNSTKYTVYNQPDSTSFQDGYHLMLSRYGGIMDSIVQTEKANHRNYRSPTYPKVGTFEIGNEVGPYAGSTGNIIGRNIITGHHDEFWRGSQTNIFNHYYDNGLALGQFGVVGTDTKANQADSGSAGNALYPCLVKGSSGKLYLWHGDESAHGGLHLWEISNLGSITEQVITIPYPSSWVFPTLNYTDLMYGLPFDSQLTSGTLGWSRSPTTNTVNWQVNTSVMTYQKFKDRDINIHYDDPSAGTATVSKNLGSNNVATFWTISGSLSMGLSAQYNNGPISTHFKILDNNGKTLTDVTLFNTGPYPNYTSGVKINTANLFSNTEVFTPTLDAFINKLRPFTLSINSGTVSFTWGSYTQTTTISDVTANWRTPTTLVFEYINNGAAGGAYGRNDNLSNGRFSKQ